MKTNAILAVAIIMVSCGQNKNKEEQESQEHIIVKQLDNEPAEFEKLREILPKKEVSSYYDSLSRTYYSWSCAEEEADSVRWAQTIISCWDLNASPSMLWMYQDSMQCEMAPTVKAAYDSFVFVKFGHSGEQDIAIAYTMGCGGDKEQNKLFLTIVDPNGSLLAKFYGFPISYNPTGGVDSLDLRYRTALGHGKHAEGKIENYYELEKYSPTNRKLIEKLWRRALRHNIGMPETVAPPPTKERIE